ncbi:IS66 family transposase [Acuticoccus sediminis]|uniref:IS66 family transposase n=1 Tax=Acuticoccus sediminis TaxID=2184697 RepID=UPI001CFCB2DD|nr:IS66 family transposase [Acuticoccus sediminis]
MTPAADLSDDPETLKAMLVAAQGEIAQLKAMNADAEARMERLTLLLKALERARYGRRSETLDPEQHAFVFEEIETGVAAIEASLEAANPARARTPRPRKALPSHLPRIEVLIEPDAGPCACGSHDRVRIGEDVTERLDVVPAKFRVIVTRRPKYGCKACRDNIVQAPASARLIEAGLPTEALLAHVAVSKYADGLPLYRQDDIYRRDGVELGRNLMAGWMGHVGFHLEPLAARVLDHIRAGPRIFADETTLPTLDPGRGRTKSAWLWAYARDDRPFGGADPPMVAYRFEDGRGGDHPARHLAGFTGILQVDGYTAYKRLGDPARSAAPVTLAACWAHLRRKFYELHVAGSSRTATWTVERMAALWHLEAEIRGRPAEARQGVRQKMAAPIVAELFERWTGELARIPRKAKTAEVIRYALPRRAALARFLHDGRVELDSNIVERAIRPQTITRKNALFAGSDAGGRTWATIATLLTTAKLNGVDPHAWLTLTLERIAAGWPNRQIDDLMPWLPLPA